MHPLGDPDAKAGALLLKASTSFLSHSIKHILPLISNTLQVYFQNLFVFSFWVPLLVALLYPKRWFSLSLIISNILFPDYSILPRLFITNSKSLMAQNLFIFLESSLPFFPTLIPSSSHVVPRISHSPAYFWIHCSSALMCTYPPHMLFWDKLRQHPAP